MSRDDRFDVRPHDTLDAASRRRAIKRLDRDHLATPRFTERLDRDIDPDLVPVFEQIRHGLGNPVDPHWLTLDPVSLDALFERGSAEPDDLERQLRDTGCTGSTIDRDPDFGRELRADAVNCERGQEADDTARDGAGGDRKSVMLGNSAVGKAVLPTGNALEDALGHESRDVLAVDPGSGGLVGSDDAVASEHGEKPRSVGFCHV